MGRAYPRDGNPRSHSLVDLEWVTFVSRMENRSSFTRNHIFPRGLFDFLVCLSSPDSLYVWRLVVLSKLRHERLFLGAHWCSLPPAPADSPCAPGIFASSGANISILRHL